MPRYLGLPAAIVRHVIVFALAAGAVVVLSMLLARPIEAQFVSWAAVAVGVGLVSAVVGRGIVGVAFLIAGFLVGLIVDFLVRLGSVDAVAETLRANGMQYLTIVVISTLAYLSVAILLARRGRARALAR